MKKINLKKGFTLIELMIVVAIIGILAAIAIPNFIKYQLRSKQTEAKTVLGGVKTAQSSFRTDYDAFVLFAQNPGIGAKNSKTMWVISACPNTCNRISISANGGTNGVCDSAECIQYRPDGDVYFEYDVVIQDPGVPVANVPEWTGCGIADLDGDGTLGGFVFGTGETPGSNGFVTLGGNAGGCDGLGATICAAGTAPASEVLNCDPTNY